MGLDGLTEVERLRLGATIASYLLAPNQGERPMPHLANAVLDVALGDRLSHTSAFVQLDVLPLFDEPLYRDAAGL